MLIRLLKYDLKKMLKFLSVFFFLALFFGLLTRLLGELNDSLALAIIKGICNGTAISMMCSLLINCFMRSWVLFRANLYGDESYLTHTLPVKRETLYASKALNAAISVLFSLVGILAVCLATYWTDDLKTLLEALLKPISDYLDVPIWAMLVFLFLTLFVEFFNGVQIGFLGLILGHKFNQGRIVKSVIFGFVAYMVTQGITLVMMLFAGLMNSDIMKLFNTSELLAVPSSVLIAASLLGFGFYVLFCIAGFFLNSFLLKRGVNVE